jgi:protein phosphatase
MTLNATMNNGATPTRSDATLGTSQGARPLAVRSFGVSDKGRVRPSNEDQFFVGTLTGALRVHQSSLPQSHVQYAAREADLFLVADGMGGAKGGEHASFLAVATIEDFLLNTLSWLFSLKAPDDDVLLKEFREALQRADARVCDVAARHPHLEGMGTTLTLACSVGSELFVAHVGDSRCCVLRGGRIHQLTKDHTMAEQILESVPPQSEKEVRAIHEQFGNVVTNIVGGPEAGVQVEVHKVHLQANDVVLLCTDGLTKMATKRDVLQILGAAADPRVACERLVALANEAGGKDNVTVIVARYEAIVPS